MKKFDSLTKSYFLYFLILVGLVVFRILSACGVFNLFGDTAEYIFTFIVQIVLLFGLSVFMFARINHKSAKDVLNDYKFKKLSKKSIFISILIGFIVYFLNSYIASFFLFILSLFGYSPSFSTKVATSYPIWLLLINIIFTAVLPAVCEETVHRGMLLCEIKKKNIKKAIIISSLLFGLLHINIYQFFYAAILGGLLAVVTLTTDSIYPAMIIHLMNNALNVYMSFASTNNLFSAKVVNLIFTMANMNTFLGVLFYIIFFVFLVICLIELYRQLCKESVKNKLSLMHEKLNVFLTRKIYFEECLNLKEGEEANKQKEVNATIINDFFNQNGEIIEKKDKNHGVFAKLFLIASVFLSALTTLFTLVWGII